MLSRRKAYAGRIKHPDDATEPATLDPLSSIAPLFRARPEIQDVCRFALQWEVVHEAEPAGVAQFHIVTNGNCLLTYGDIATVTGISLSSSSRRTMSPIGRYCSKMFPMLQVPVATGCAHSAGAMEVLLAVIV